MTESVTITSEDFDLYFCEAGKAQLAEGYSFVRPVVNGFEVFATTAGDGWENHTAKENAQYFMSTFDGETYGLTVA